MAKAADQPDAPEPQAAVVMSSVVPVADWLTRPVVMPDGSMVSDIVFRMADGRRQRIMPPLRASTLPTVPPAADERPAHEQLADEIVTYLGTLREGKGGKRGTIAAEVGEAANSGTFDRAMDLLLGETGEPRRIHKLAHGVYALAQST